MAAADQHNDALHHLWHSDLLGCWIDGALRLDDYERTIVPLASPLLAGTWKRLVVATARDVEDAIAAAQRAMAGWRALSAAARAAILTAVAEALLGAAELLAHAMAYEMGKPLREGRAEVRYAADYFRWLAGEGERVYGAVLPAPGPGQAALLFREPVGVCAIITPWNFPLAMAARKAAAALAAGCAVVAKPSPECPVTLLLLAALMQRCGLPAGLFNVLLGDEQLVGAALLGHGAVRKLSFTGSNAVGKLLYRASADTLKKLTLELGGHAPFVVCADADLDQAVEAALYAKLRNGGQTCIAPNRFLLQRPIADAFCEMLVARLSRLRVGDPRDEESDLSAVLHPSALHKVQSHSADARRRGARCLLEGGSPAHPQVLYGVTCDMLLWHEETFGPLFGMTPFDELDEGIGLANATPYGLAAYAFTADLAGAWRLMSRLHYGVIGLNEGAVSNARAPFGGVKLSGFGREGGPGALDEYLVTKYVALKAQ